MAERRDRHGPSQRADVVVGEERRLNSGFQVRAERTSVIADWLRFQQKAADNPLLISGSQHPTTLALDNIEIGDSLIAGLQADIRVDLSDESYELSSLFAPEGRGKMKHVSPSGMPPGLARMMMGMEVEPSEPAMAVRVFKGILAQDQSFMDNYTFIYEERTDSISITQKQGDEDQSVQTVYKFKKEQTPLGNEYYALVVKEDEISDASIERLQEYHPIIAELTQHLVKAYYKANYTEEPDKTFIIAPPKNTPKIIKQMDDMLNVKRKMLSANGMMDDSADLEEQIERNIIMERRPDVTFDDIGGNETAKETLLTVVDALRNPGAYDEWGTEAPRGVLLIGPKGTGKTLLAKALANEADADIYVINTADVLHSLYGRTERLIQAIFDRAKQGDRPAVLLFDELDALAANRNMSNEVTSRIVSVLLQNLDGLEERDGGAKIIVVGTTNRFDAIDPALTRPNRFGDVIEEVKLPDQGARRQIFTIHMDKARAKAQREIFVDDLDLEPLVTSTNEFSGADIKEIIRRALAKKARARSAGGNPGPVTAEELSLEITGYEQVRRVTSSNTGQYL